MQDAMHEIPAIRSAELGYHILLEKPMAPTEEACRRIVDAVRKANVYFARSYHAMQKVRLSVTERNFYIGMRR